MSSKFFGTQQKNFQSHVLKYIQKTLNKKFTFKQNYLTINKTDLEKLFNTQINTVKKRMFKVLVLSKIIRYDNKNTFKHDNKICDYVIGRKYKPLSKDTFINNAFGHLVKITPTKSTSTKKQKLETNVKPIVNSSEIMKTILNITKSNNIEEMFNKSSCIDIEYITDISDSFSLFPEAENNAHIFMIGIMPCTSKNVLVLSSDEIKVSHEYNLLKSFILNCETNKTKYLIHWSHADKTYLLKALNIYPDLIQKFNLLDIEFVDLMKIVKTHSTFESYALKQIVLLILNYTYNSNCKNGYDALIESLINYDSVKSDIIKYNEQDTMLLKNLIIHFQDQVQSSS
jgi:hypothetical protein